MDKKLLTYVAILFIGAAALGVGTSYATNILTTNNNSALKPVTLTVVTQGSEAGSRALPPLDNQTHDTMMPSNITIYVGQQVDLVVVNYDGGSHSITSPTMGIDFRYGPATANNVPSVTHFHFTANKAGTYLWYCAVPCDSDANGWGMSHPGFMSGYIIVLNS